MKIFIGLLGIGIGVLLSLKYKWLLNNFGRIPTVEKYLGSYGGSRLFYQLLGVLMVLLSTMYMTGLLEKAITSIFSIFFGSAS